MIKKLFSDELEKNNCGVDFEVEARETQIFIRLAENSQFKNVDNCIFIKLFILNLRSKKNF